MKRMGYYLSLGWLCWLGSTTQAQIDRDNNGLGDIWEKRYTVTGDANADPDDDGASNRTESQAGTNPNDDESFLRILRCRYDSETGRPVIEWPTEPGKRYDVEWTAQLVGPDSRWELLESYDHEGPASVLDLQLELPGGSSPPPGEVLFFRILARDRDRDGDGLTAWEEYTIGTIDADENNGAPSNTDANLALAWLEADSDDPEIEEPDGEVPFDDIEPDEDPEESDGEEPDEDPEHEDDPEDDLGEELEWFLLDLYFFAQEEPEEASEEFPPGTLLGDLLLDLHPLEDEEAVFEFYDGLTEAQREQIIAEIRRWEALHEDEEDPDGEEPDEEPEDGDGEEPDEDPEDGNGEEPDEDPEDGDDEEPEDGDEPDMDPMDGDAGENPTGGHQIPYPSGIQIPAIPVLQTQSTPVMSQAEAARFLTQATLGANYEMIDQLSRSGFEAWLDHQFALPPGYHLPAANRLAINVREEGEFIPESPYRWTWWEMAMKSPDVLRQRVAFALSEILVVSDLTDELEDNQWALASYYDILVDGAFGNYRDTLMRVSQHSVMGHWLSHAKNQPTDLSLNRFPDENYAREVMQLFSIGLFELNPDGTRRQDVNGQDIPTYDNRDITELAKVFTGMTYNPGPPTDGSPQFGEDPEDPDVAGIFSEEDFLEVEARYLTHPMWLYEPMHESGPKTVLGTRIPGGTIQEDLGAAIDILFNHPNTGPFIGYRLIQRLVTSNPSPAYVARVAAAFANNGQGVRGDMQTVIKAILLDPEARDLGKRSDPTWGMLREPYVRYVHLCRAFNATSRTGAYRNTGERSAQAMAQLPMHAPSVFNFFLPDYQPLGPIAEAGLVAPEFQITTATTSVATINFWAASLKESLMDFNEDLLPNETRLNLEAELALANDIPALMDRLDILLTQGALSSEARAIISSALQQLPRDTDREETVQLAIYLFLNSPDFAVLR